MVEVLRQENLHLSLYSKDINPMKSIVSVSLEHSYWLLGLVKKDSISFPSYTTYPDCIRHFCSRKPEPLCFIVLYLARVTVPYYPSEILDFQSEDVNVL